MPVKSLQTGRCTHLLTPEQAWFLDVAMRGSPMPAASRVLHSAKGHQSWCLCWGSFFAQGARPCCAGCLRGSGIEDAAGASDFFTLKTLCGKELEAICGTGPLGSSFFSEDRGAT